MRISIVKSKNAESIYIIKSVRKNGKSTSSTFKKLGTMETLLPVFQNNRELVLEWAHEQAAHYTALEKQKKLDTTLQFTTNPIPRTQSPILNAGYLFYESIFYDLRIDEIFHKIQTKYNLDFDLLTVASRLCYSILLFPDQSFETICLTYLESCSFDTISMYRTLAILAQEKKFIVRALNTHFNNQHTRDLSLVFEHNFYILYEDSAKFRTRSFSDKYNPLLTCCFTYDYNSVPLDYSVKTIQTHSPMSLSLNKAQIDAPHSIQCQDSIFPTNASKTTFYTSEISINKLPARIQEWAISVDAWFLDSKSKEVYNLHMIDESINNTYYKERKIEVNKQTLRLIILYNPTKRSKSQIERLDLFHRISLAATKADSKKDSSLFTNLLRMLDQDSTVDGFTILVTTSTNPVSTIIQEHNNLIDTAPLFHSINPIFYKNSNYLSTTMRPIAHTTLCFIALYLRQSLVRSLNNKYSHQEINASLASMSFKKIDGHGYLPLYTPSPLIDKLHEQFGFTTDMQFLSDDALTNIINHIKQRKN